MLPYSRSGRHAAHSVKFFLYGGNERLMCGIAGFFLKDGASLPQGAMDVLSEALAHRGPDGEGRYLSEDGRIALLHTRLSIIDVAGGAQPITTKDGQAVIVGNGEIYNYQHLRTHNERMGAVFHAGSDNEVGLHAFVHEKSLYPSQLDGMFALAVYDVSRKTLTLCRDRCGIKPLYYYEAEWGVVFASEITAIRPFVHGDDVPGNFCAARASLFLNRRYVFGAHTMMPAVKRVLPGEVLTLDAGAIASRRFFAATWLTAPQAVSEHEALKLFEEKWHKAVSTHLQSDVPVGVFLSGGVDSSAVVAMMAKLGVDIKAYSLGFDRKSVADERRQAAILCNAVGAELTTITFTEKDFWHYLFEMGKRFDDPVADYAILPLMKLADVASRDVTVVLCGEGGDEIFAGYVRYRPKLLHTLVNRPDLARNMLTKVKGLLTPEARKAAKALARQAPEVFLTQDAAWTGLQKRQLEDICSWLPDDLLVKADRCTMAYGIEGRVPFLDNDMASFGFSLPDALKIRGKSGKWLVKTWLENVLCDFGIDGKSFVWQKKRSFSVPAAEYLEKEKGAILAYLTSHPAFAGIIDTEKLATWWRTPISKPAGKFVFNLVALALWYDVHLARHRVERLSLYCDTVGAVHQEQKVS